MVIDSNCLSGAAKLVMLFKDLYCIAPISDAACCQLYPNKSDVPAPAVVPAPTKYQLFLLDKN